MRPEVLPPLFSELPAELEPRFDPDAVECPGDVDENGVVTYSSRPVQGSAESAPLKLPPGPTEEQKAEARARLERSKQLGAEMEQARQTRSTQRQAEEESVLTPLTGSGTTIGARPTREEVEEAARRKSEELKESVEETKQSAREELARRREERGSLPREPVHIQPVPAPGDARNRQGGADPVRMQPVPSIGSPLGPGTPGAPGRGRGRRGGGS